MLWLFPVAVAAVFVLFGAGLVGAGLVRLRRWWTMTRLDPTGMAAESGLQEFEGQARSVAGTVTAPFTEAEALICDWSIDRYSPNDDGKNWKTVESATETAAFELDHTGPTVAVDPDEAQLLLETNASFDTYHDDLPERVAAYLDRSTGALDLGPIDLGGGQRYRFTEQRLDPGDQCYVLGPVETGAAQPPGDSTARLSIAPSIDGWRSRLLGDPFVVSDAGERQAQRRQLTRGVALLVFGLLFAGFPVALVAVGI